MCELNQISILPKWGQAPTFNLSEANMAVCYFWKKSNTSTVSIVFYVAERDLGRLAGFNSYFNTSRFMAR